MKIVIGSVNRGAGKTSMIIGLAKALGKPFGYMKPFGDRLFYKKKRLWDYDSAVVTGLFNLGENPEDMSIGFEHAKLKYMYSGEEMAKKLKGEAARNGGGRDMLFIEGPGTLSAGASVHMDVIGISRTLGARLILILSGREDSVVDDAAFVKKYVDTSKIDFGGVIVNKVTDINDFKDTYLGQITELGIDVLGAVPYKNELGLFSAGYIADMLFAKVLAGEGGLKNTVSRVYIGAMSVDHVLKKDDFDSETKKLVITSGDRSDMVLAALETGSSAVILTNNILPPSNIISRASDMNVPLLLVPSDTFQVAKKIDEMEPLITKGATDKADLLGKLVSDHIRISKL